jgi:arsenite/tail-anchored protein-transporting ATPase
VDTAANKGAIMEIYTANLARTKFLFFEGKGGVGKTSLAAATAVGLADQVERILIVSTDPASNLQDVFEQPIGMKPTPIKGVKGLDAVNLDPLKAAQEYRDSVIAPYVGKLPESAIANMKEQLSGSCTVEIASFDAFASFLSDDTYFRKYDHIIFDTAPTGHTLRLLELPSAWSGFIANNDLGASCLGQLSGLSEKRANYEKAMNVLKDETLTTMIYVARADDSLREAARAAQELETIGIHSHLLVVNAFLESNEPSLKPLIEKQKKMCERIDPLFQKIAYLPLRGYDLTGLKGLRLFLYKDEDEDKEKEEALLPYEDLVALVDDLISSKKRIVMMMGKGGVGKTSLAIRISLEFLRRGEKVTLTSTDPADHISELFSGKRNLTLKSIDEKKELSDYQAEVLAKAKYANVEEGEMAYIAEGLRSPCTQEIATFRAFANIVEKAKDSICVIDTAPTGHTLLLLNSAEAYNREIQHNGGEATAALRDLLPRLQSSETSIIIVSLPEQTPILEAKRLQDELSRASLPHKWWIVNRSYRLAGFESGILKQKGKQEGHWINEANRLSRGNLVVLPFCKQKL